MPAVEFKTHTPPEGNTHDLTLRVSEIANGWVIKAGGKPFYCRTREELTKALLEVVEKFADSGR